MPESFEKSERFCTENDDFILTKRYFDCKKVLSGQPLDVFLQQRLFGAIYY